MKKKLISLLLSAVMIVTFMPAMAFAGTDSGDAVKTLLMATGTAKAKKQVVKWTEVSGAEGYDVFFAQCEKTLKKVKTVKAGNKLSFTKKKLNDKKAYRWRVKAFKTVDGEKTYIYNSPIIHVAGKSCKHSNATAVKLSQKSAEMKVDETLKLVAKISAKSSKKAVLSKGHAAAIRYYSSNKTVAKVSSTGKVTAVGEGVCYVYAVAPSGAYAKSKITVEAKSQQVVEPTPQVNPTPSPAPSPAPSPTPGPAPSPTPSPSGHVCRVYQIDRTDGSWHCTNSACGKTLKGTEEAYCTVLTWNKRPNDIFPLAGGQPTKIISLGTDGIYKVGAGAIKVSGNKITYENESEVAQTVVIRTTSLDTILTINAPNDVVEHYDKASKINVMAVAMTSYHEFGNILGNINLIAGNVVVEEDCKASAVVIKMTAQELATVTTLSADNSKATYVPIILNTTEQLWEVNPHNELIDPDKNSIIYAKHGDTQLPDNFDDLSKTEKEKAIKDASAQLEDYGAMVDDVCYETFEIAIGNVQTSGQTIRLLKDYKYSTSPSYVYTNKADYTIDLNGHTLDFNDSGYGLYLLKGQTVTLNDSEGTGALKNKQCIIYMIDGSNLIINGGHICGTDKDQATIYGYGSLTINGGIIETARKNGYNYYAVMIGNYTNNDTPAKYIMTGGEVNGSLYINGQDTDTNIINISGGAINASSYIAGENITTITGGTFTGTTCFYFKAGTVNISGGTFTSTKGDGDWKHEDSKCLNTGDAVIFEACGYPAGKPEVIITGGSFKGYKEEGGTESTSGNIFFKNYGILVIDYGGNKADVSNTTVPYRHAVVASNTAEGFVTENGYIHFTDENTKLELPQSISTT